MYSFSVPCKQVSLRGYGRLDAELLDVSHPHHLHHSQNGPRHVLGLETLA